MFSLVFAIVVRVSLLCTCRAQAALLSVVSHSCCSCLALVILSRLDRMIVTNLVCNIVSVLLSEIAKLIHYVNRKRKHVLKGAF